MRFGSFCSFFLTGLGLLSFFSGNHDGAQSGPYYASMVYDNDDEGESVDPIPEDLESLEEFPTTPTTEEEDNSGKDRNLPV